ncbi:lipopolysaccharide biosynthesis protein [Methylobacterium haplocladii]|uniref:Uncharacterized protein n=1 Tax=Methylobacterium haplocladii TaxID=1176176 RepID=A0A512IVX3_9HYPH|nr:lipopolysaccharide biosynthesis protein [Methylobacterium haplocladii]GEP01749.1 hypothetical protein MHA02_41360 [Methylobacterium haplocladii]GJD86006.1 hypothetical protein HPGCJGGD_3901 [Methylobacterium haplocladii]GLS59716.1 hypothetical protein GCM10007887_23870 [Methylobacterium haplocladii]
MPVHIFSGTSLFTDVADHTKAIPQKFVRAAHAKADVLLAVAAQIFQQIATFVTGVMIARAIGVEQYGISNLVRNTFTMISIVAPLGLEIWLLRFYGVQRAQGREIQETLGFMRVVCLVINIGLLVCIFLPYDYVVSHFVYKYPDFMVLLGLSLLVVPAAADLSILGSVYKSESRFGLYSLLTIGVQSLVRLLLVVTVLQLSPTVLTVILINIAQLGLSYVGTLVHFGLRLRAKIPTPPAIEDVARGAGRAFEVLSVSVWFAGSTLVYGALRLVDVLLLGAFSTAKAVGEYSALSAIAQLVQLYPLAASQSIGPQVATAHERGDMEGLRAIYRRYARQASLVAGFVFGGVAYFGSHLDLLFGKSFAFQPAVAGLIAFGHLLSAIFAPLGFCLSMTGRHRLEFGILLGGIVVLVASCCLLIPIYDQAGCAVSVALAFAAVNVARSGLVFRIFGFFPATWRDALPPLAALPLAAGADFLVRPLGERTLVTTGLACALYAVFYLPLLIWPKPLQREPS